jgi:formylglycine-generating enzyme required for sulfatase activity
MRLFVFAAAILSMLSMTGCDFAGGGSAREGSAPIKTTWMARTSGDKAGQYADLTVGTATLRFRYIPPGSFSMGSLPGDSPWRGEDEVAHQVKISKGFWLAETEVTQELWQVVMGGNPSQFRDPKRPVDSVSWEAAQRFVNTLNHHVAGLDARLPTEAEWEYACRAGSTGPFATDAKAKDAAAATDLGWFLSNSGGEPHLPKQKAPNAWGLYDMHGNLQEWCQDVYAHYSSGTDPLARADTGPRMVRGGSWRLPEWNARSASRRSADPGTADNSFGLRLAAPAPTR